MNLLQSLTKHLIKTTRLKRENVHSYADNGELLPVLQDLGHGLQIARFKYDGIFELESFPGDGFELLAIISCWLDENDHERNDLELPAPEINIQVNDRHTCDIDITIEFDEPIEIVPDPKGSISYDGQKWKVKSVSIDTAEELNDLKNQEVTDGTA